MSHPEKCQAGIREKPICRERCEPGSMFCPQHKAEARARVPALREAPEQVVSRPASVQVYG